MKLPTIKWSEVEEELIEQGLDPKKVLDEAVASYELWSSLSPIERKKRFEYPSLESE